MTMVFVLGLLAMASIMMGVIVGFIWHSAELGAAIGGSAASVPALMASLAAIVTR